MANKAHTNRQGADMGKRISRCKRRISPGSVLGATAVVVAFSGAAYAAIPGSDGTIKGCYATTDALLLGIPHSKGDMRAVDGAENCRSYEKTVTWNQKGPKGDPGPAGPPGPSFANVTVRVKNISGTGGASGTASCESGELATGGGFFAGGNGSYVRVLKSHPEPPVNGAQPTGWHVWVVQDNENHYFAGGVYAICAAM